LKIREYVSGVKRGTLGLEKIPLNIFSYQEFLVGTFNECPNRLIAFMNLLNAAKVRTVIDQYDGFPEWIFGKLFALGLDPDLIPENVKLHPNFLRIAAQLNPHRLVDKITGKIPSPEVRKALACVPETSVAILQDNGMSGDKIPRRALLADKLFSRGCEPRGSSQALATQSAQKWK
jgi:hypothetical protein